MSSPHRTAAREEKKERAPAAPPTTPPAKRVRGGLAAAPAAPPLPFVSTMDGRARGTDLGLGSALSPGSAAPFVLPAELQLPHDDDTKAKAAARAFAEKAARKYGPPVLVNAAEHRGTTLCELVVLVEHVKQHCSAWVRTRRDEVGSVILDADREPVVTTRGLKAEDVNLYDVNLNLLAQLGAEFGVAYSELFARGEQRTPKVFLSHAWSHPLLQTVEALKQHAKDRGYGEDEPVWICAFAIRQHDVEISASIKESPFFMALKVAAMTLIVISAVDMGVLFRAWCALEAFLAMVEVGARHLTDIYTYHEGDVLRLTDGLIAEDSNYASSKAKRDASFPLSVVLPALSFELRKTKASVQTDKDNIEAHVGEMENGEAVVNATVRARYFVAALPAILKSEDGLALFNAGTQALRISTLPRLALATEIPEAQAFTLVNSLPSTIVELLLPDVGIGDTSAELVGRFVEQSKVLTVLNLQSNKIGDVGAIGLGKALEINIEASLTRLDLERNKIADKGVISLAEGLKFNKSLTELHLSLNKIVDAGAIGLAEGLKVNKSLTKLHLYNNQIADVGAVALGKALAVNASLTELDLRDNQVGDQGAIGLGKALEVNASLTKLDLSENKIAGAGATGLGNALQVNASLTVLSLYGNQIAEKGAIGIAGCLKINTSLIELDLRWNNIADAGAEALGKALATNASLTRLDLYGNQIGDKGAIGLAGCLKVNTTLNRLFLGANPIGDAGAVAIRKAVET